MLCSAYLFVQYKKTAIPSLYSMRSAIIDYFNNVDIIKLLIGLMYSLIV